MDEANTASLEHHDHDDHHADKAELRLWLRILSTGNLVSNEIRRKLRTEFDVTLPRFDLLAQLQRAPQGLRFGELSKRLMVTNGNLTGLVDRLVEEGYVVREPVPGDRRGMVVRATKAGSAIFARMAVAHEAWIKQLFGSMEAQAIDRLIDDLQNLKKSVRQNRLR